MRSLIRVDGSAQASSVASRLQSLNTTSASSAFSATVIALEPPEVSIIVHEAPSRPPPPPSPSPGAGVTSPPASSPTASAPASGGGGGGDTDGSGDDDGTDSTDGITGEGTGGGGGAVVAAAGASVAVLVCAAAAFWYYRRRQREPPKAAEAAEAASGNATSSSKRRATVSVPHSYPPMAMITIDANKRHTRPPVPDEPPPDGIAICDEIVVSDPTLSLGSEVVVSDRHDGPLSTPPRLIINPSGSSPHLSRGDSTLDPAKQREWRERRAEIRLAVAEELRGRRARGVAPESVVVSVAPGACGASPLGPRTVAAATRAATSRSRAVARRSARAAGGGAARRRCSPRLRARSRSIGTGAARNRLRRLR